MSESFMFDKLGKIVVPRKYIAQSKVLFTRLRFKYQLKKSRNKFREHKKKYKNNILFVAGLPKSGTSWLENMLSEFPGFKKNMLHQATKFEQRNKGSHFLELKKEWFQPLKKSLTVLKLHNYGSANNADILKELDIPYVVLYRDLRDVAVSHYFYVRNTWHHPEYEDYNKLDIRNGLLHFAQTLLPDFKNWIYSWLENIDPNLGMMVRYEDLKKETYNVFKKITEHYELPADKKTLKYIIEKYSFENLSGGRRKGEENRSSFFRKGISGDWKNYFNNEIRECFKEEIGQLLIDVGYEEDTNW